MITVTLAPKFRKKLLERFRKRLKIGERRSGIHVSDLLFCLRKAWAERVSNFASDVPDSTILDWLRGLSHEDLLAGDFQQVRAGYCFRCSTLHPWSAELERTQRCPECEDTLMIGTVDWCEFEGDRPVLVEMKSTQYSSNRAVESFPWYLDQLKTYLAIHGADYGYLVIFHVNGNYRNTNGTRADLQAAEIRWNSEQERVGWLKEMQRRKMIVEGDELPPLGPDSPIYDYQCKYCMIGEKLPDGSVCERWLQAHPPSTPEQSLEELEQWLKARLSEHERRAEGTTE
jgi:hypothetical protein